MTENICVLCGDVIPEGRQVCHKCEKSKQCPDCRYFVGCEKAVWVRFCDEYEEAKK